jgi:hypothetical protein
MSNIRWSESLVEQGIMGLAAFLRRMPTSTEMPGQLSEAIIRYGGFDHWAARLGLTLKQTETNVARSAEAHVADMLRARGHDVIRQRLKSPFDLLVDGALRVDVKASSVTTYPRKTGKHAGANYTFTGCKRGQDCDVFVLVCLRDGDPFAHFVVPAAEVRGVTLSIGHRNLMGGGRSKWKPYRDRFDLIPAPAAND